MTASSTALQAMAAVSSRLDQVATRIARSAAPDTFDSADISAEAVQLLSARTAFELAVRVTKIANEVDKNLIDLLA